MENPRFAPKLHVDPQSANFAKVRVKPWEVPVDDARFGERLVDAIVAKVTQMDEDGQPHRRLYVQFEQRKGDRYINTIVYAPGMGKNAIEDVALGGNPNIKDYGRTPVPYEVHGRRGRWVPIEQVGNVEEYL